MTGRVRVLVVDDDEFVARLHASFLEHLDGFEVVAIVGTGPDAVAAASALAPQIILLDMHLPGLSGLEVLRALRGGRASQAEVVAVTAARDLATVREARLAGVRHYLAKPFSAADLKSRLEEIARDLSVGVDRPLAQAEIDAMMTPSARPHALPKGLSSETLELVEAALRRSPGASAADIGDDVGLSRVSTRRYLEFLVEGGAARRRLEYGSGGRPATRYDPTAT
jgi:response regulator of citrate/malate metabolism